MAEKPRVTWGDGQEFREVENFTEKRNPDGSLELSWDRVEGATEYRIIGMSAIDVRRPDGTLVAHYEPGQTVGIHQNFLLVEACTCGGVEAALEQLRRGEFRAEPGAEPAR